MLDELRESLINTMNRKLDENLEIVLRMVRDGFCDPWLLPGFPFELAVADIDFERAPPGGDSAEEFSETNNQVSGVDEADFVKNDGSYIYILADNKPTPPTNQTYKYANPTNQPTNKSTQQPQPTNPRTRIGVQRLVSQLATYRGRRPHRRGLPGNHSPERGLLAPGARNSLGRMLVDLLPLYRRGSEHDVRKTSRE